MNYQKLLEISDDWLKYAIRLHLCHEDKENLVDSRKAALADSRIKRYLADITDFHGMLVTNHKNPDLPIHKLLFLIDLGFGTEIPEIQAAVDEILKHRDENGIYQSMTNVPKHFGGTGEDVFSWCLCDAPLLLLALLKLGADYREHIQPGVEYLVSLCRDNGFPCAVSPELGKFHGPGRKDDCCPYATLIMADLLSHIPEYKNTQTAVSAVKALLSLWENSLSQHPYMFFMGTDFRKLKAPSYWYDIVSVAGVLGKYKFVREDPRFLEMIQHIKAKQDEDSLFTPESVYLKLKDWDFGQKKMPSPYLTYLCHRIFERLE
ncbi:MAG: hypothetical protein GX900_04550 [Clostridiaceae bacterium]|nr:hypothetical protein [Clostridiaceae bacterium]